MQTTAWRFTECGGPERLTRVEQTLPAPGPGEALVRLDAIGLNRADLLFLAGHYITQPPSPSFLGQEAVGEVVSLGPPDPAEPTGPAGASFAVGDQVGLLVGRVDYAGMGTFRQHGIYRQSALVPWPDALSADTAAGLWVTGLTAAGGLRAGGLTPENAAGRTIAITAASSGVGVAALQIARAWGANTVAVSTSAQKLDRLGSLADRVVHATSQELLIEGLHDATDSHGIDLAFDPVGFANLPGLFQAAATDGQIVCYGIMAGTEAPFDLVSLLRKDLGVHGFTVYRLLRDPEKLNMATHDVLNLSATGALCPLVARTFSFDRAPEALAAMATNQHVGKIVVFAG